MTDTSPELTPSDPRRFPFPPAIPVVAWLLSWGLQRVWPLNFHLPQWTRWIGGVLLLTAPLFAMWAAITFRRHQTTMNPLGKSMTIVKAGPFRFTRNPMYLSLLVLYLGGILAFRLPWGLPLLLPVFLALHLGVILPEEKYLASRFASDYSDYKNRVRRWL